MVTLDQSTAKGWRTLGNVVSRDGRSPVVHLADNATTTGTIVADAARFRVLATPPSGPTGVGAAAGPASATVAWSASAPNGAAVTSYVVTASPGPATATVSGTARSATVAGLLNGTAYTFLVRATNLAGPGRRHRSPAQPHRHPRHHGRHHQCRRDDDLLGPELPHRTDRREPHPRSVRR